VTGNTLVNNDYGVSCWSNTQNVIYHNNFVNNTHQSFSEDSSNFWDNGYPSGGNYWSDYNGTDLYSGPYQNGTGSDGIGDASYVIDAYNRDNYPLMGLFSKARADINGDGVVDGSDLIIIARAFGSYGPNYLGPGSPQHPRWNPIADVNSDGVVDGSDVILTTRMFGHH
jgi:parallel beta-helix repeat protein